MEDQQFCVILIQWGGAEKKNRSLSSGCGCFGLCGCYHHSRHGQLPKTKRDGQGYHLCLWPFPMEIGHVHIWVLWIALWPWTPSWFWQVMIQASFHPWLSFQLLAMVVHDPPDLQSPLSCWCACCRLYYLCHRWGWNARNPIKWIFDRLFLEFWVFAEDSTHRIERSSKLLLEKLVSFSDALGLGLYLPVF